MLKVKLCYRYYRITRGSAWQNEVTDEWRNSRLEASPRRSKRKASSQTVGSGKKKTKSSTKVTGGQWNGCGVWKPTRRQLSWSAQDPEQSREIKRDGPSENFQQWNTFNSSNGGSWTSVALSLKIQIQTVLCIFTCVFIRFLADGLKNEFVRLYQECATVADKYLKFQLKWHQHCNYLVDCNHW